MIDDRSLYRRFGVLLKRVRQGKEVTQQDLAAAVGLSRTSIANIEAGNQAVSLAVLYGLADALDEPVEQLLPAHQEVRDAIEEAEGLPAATRRDLMALWGEED